MKLERPATTSVLIALLAVAVGAVFLVWGANAHALWRSVLLINVGSFLIASVAMAVIFEFWQLSGLLNELMDRARITEELRRARLSGFSVRFFDGVDWGALFENSTQLRVFFSYGRTWRNSHQGQLMSFVSKPGRTLEVVLPNPDDAAVVAELSRRYEMTTQVLEANIRESVAFFEGLGRGGQAHVVVYLSGKTPVYTFYRFNSRVVVALYRHRSGRGPIVTFTAEHGGECYEWIESEWQAIMTEDPKGNLVVAFDSHSAPTRS